jgi:hypothetical protein
MAGRIVSDAPWHGPLLANEVLHPREVVEVRAGQGRFPYPFKTRRGELPFFRMWEDKYLQVNAIAADPDVIYYYKDVVVAKNLDLFMRRLVDDPAFPERAVLEEYRRRDRLKAKPRKKARKSKKVEVKASVKSGKKTGSQPRKAK